MIPVWRNYAYKLIGEGGVRLLSTVFLLILARIVGASEFGIYSTAFAVATVFAILVDLGVNPIVTREIARRPDKRPQIVAAVNFLKTSMALVMWLLLWVSTDLVHMSGERARLVHWFGWVAVGTASTEYFSAILTGVERMASEALVKVASKSVVIVAALIVLFQTHDVFSTVRAMGLFSILSIAVGAGILRYRLGAFGFDWDAPYLRELLGQSFPVFGSMALLILYDSQDILLLNYFRVSDRDIGLFAMALKIIDVMKVLPVLLASTYLPSLSRHARLSLKDFFERAKDLLWRAGIAFPLLAALIAVFSPQIIHLLYGSGYAAAVPVLRWLLIGFLVMSLNMILMQVLIAMDKEQQLLIGSGLLCVSHFAACAGLIPRYGIMGACYALIISEVIYLTAQGYLVLRVYHSHEHPAVSRPARRAI
jgi:O-antigen/teichoic acid export membrane protein